MTDKIKNVITWPVVGVIGTTIAGILAILFNYLPANAEVKSHDRNNLNMMSNKIDYVENQCNKFNEDINDRLDTIENGQKIILKYVLKLNGKEK